RLAQSGHTRRSRDARPPWRPPGEDTVDGRVGTRSPSILHFSCKVLPRRARILTPRAHGGRRTMVTFAVNRREFLSGGRAMVPWLLGVAPFGLIIGVSSAHTSIPTLAGVMTGPVIYSGSAQVATIQLLSAGAAPIVVVGTGLIINIRLIFYSAAMAQY